MTLLLFSNYTAIRVLGQGGMATVYLATHNTLGHKVAIKVLDKQFAYNQNIKARFIEEAKKLVRLDHPNVVKVTDFISENEHVAYVMEYINGKSLRELLNAKRLTDVEIENYLNQMVLALNYIHKEGIVHRDIKPSNFIIATNGTLKLVDFGISKSIDASSVDHTSTSTNLSMGTLLYMSPEQIKSTKDVTYLSDIYSLGVVLWEMAMGKVPYNSSELSAFDIQVKIVQEKLPNTNTKWDEYIQIATSKEENQRVRFIDLLGKKHENRSTSSNNTNFNDQTVFETEHRNIEVKKPKQNRKLIYLGVSILLLSAIAFFYLFMNNDSDLSTNVEQVIPSRTIYIENNTDDNIFVSYAIYDDSLKEFITQGWDYYEKDSAYSFELADYHSKKIFWHAFKEKSREIISNQGYKFCVNYDEDFTYDATDCKEKASFNILRLKEDTVYLGFGDLKNEINLKNNDFENELISDKKNNYFDQVSEYQNGLAVVTKNNKFGLINKRQEILIPLEYDILSHDVDDRLIFFRKGEDYFDPNGFFDLKGNIVLQAKNGYRYSFDFEDGLVEMFHGDKCGFVDKKGNVIIPLDYTYPKPFYKGSAPVHINDGFFLINKRNEIISKKYDWIGYERDGLRKVYNKVYFEKNDFLKTKYKHGYIDEKGNVIIPLIYDSADDFRDGSAKVELNGEEFSINKQGQCLKDCP